MATISIEDTFSMNLCKVFTTLVPFNVEEISIFMSPYLSIPVWSLINNWYSCTSAPIFFFLKLLTKSGLLRTGFLIGKIFHHLKKLSLFNITSQTSLSAVVTRTNCLQLQLHWKKRDVDTLTMLKTISCYYL